MRPPKLYITFFLSFTFILIITLLIIFGIYRVTEEKARASFIREQVRLYTFERVLLLRELIEEKIRSRSDQNQMEIIDENLRSLIAYIAKVNTAKVWITSNNKVLIKSFADSIPDKPDDSSDKNRYIYEGISLYQGFNETRDIYAVSPLKSPLQDDIEFHILFGERRVERHETGFILSLAAMGIIIPLLVIPISRFITERVKQLEESALRIASGDLSHRIDIKGNDEIGELGKAFNQMADKVERMIVGGKSLTAHVSHELRTPLTRIRIAEEILREKLENEKGDVYLRHLDDIREDIDLLNKLIGRILELSKIDMHEVRFEMDTFDIRQMINDLIYQLKPIIDRKNLNVQTDLSFIPGFKGNSGSLSTALLNVLDNAVKYTEPYGQIFVSLSQKGGHINLSVINSYKRLNDVDLGRIFEPFQRVEGSNESGSGLGLAITHKIIERHGGSALAFNSEKGFEIRIILPLHGL
ncbi:MAG: HAMP domain-containing histidine kinase [Deltaproteobacteria bacterium]|nr:HAMP domain-containing histidine kinase [Deltaproteobacteria bacterium]